MGYPGEEKQPACYEGNIYKFELNQYESLEIEFWFINPSVNNFETSSYIWLSEDVSGELPDRAAQNNDDSTVQSLVSHGF